MSRHLLRKALRLPKAAVKRLVTGLLQLVLLANRPARLARSGFVLPTTVLLVLMVVLTATALTYRSFTRSDMAISQREQQVIANAATPALDRARAKIEFIFNKDTRLSSGLPTGDFLASMMLANPYEPGLVALPNDPFTLPDETRLDINNDTKLDNAWSFVSAANGETIIYSIVVDDQATPTDPLATTGTGIQNITSPVTPDKAKALITRTGPLATTEATAICSNARAEKGWQVVNNGSTSALQKNFQINVFVPNANDVNRTVEAFEFQQSRIANRGNKWAAWFRYDMEIYPGAPFTINGAMHTDSNLMASGGSQNGSSLTSYKISSHNSCVYGKEASEITVGAQSTDGTFQGQIVNGFVGNNTYGGNDAIFHIWDGDNNAPITDKKLTAANDSVNGGGPADVAVNPLVLFTEDRLAHTDASTWNRDNAWENNPIFTGERIFNKRVAKPFVDDFSRADNRWGPKPRYSDSDLSLSVSATRPAGSKITGADLLTDDETGLDGYWERQGINNGLRLIVGERLELGNPIEWNRNPATNIIDKDRLYPPNAEPTVGTLIKANEYRQKRALRDNLAAVQSMVVYHHENSNGEFPAACMAMTAHPGSRQSIINSRTFGNYATATGRIKTDFLRGTGTNGWEFQFPAAFNTPTGFASAIANGQPLGIALRNLARFAGDPSGGAPYFQAVQDGNVHPAPFLSMWGDFSPLRRIFNEYLDASPAVAYADLSAADKATLHSAACTVSMLAYNIQSDYLEAQALASSDLDLQIQNIGSLMRNVLLRINNYLVGPNDPTLAGSGLRVSELFAILGKTRTWVDNNINSTFCETGFTDAAGYQKECDFGEYFAEYTRNDWITILDRGTNATDAEVQKIATFTEKIDFLTSTIRDRELGFRVGLPRTALGPATPPGNTVIWDNTNGYTEALPVSSLGSARFKLQCNPNLFGGTVAQGGGGKEDVGIFGYIACSQSTAMNVRYPSLYYLFPLVAHDHDGADYHQQPNGTTPLPNNGGLQPAEEYIMNGYVRSVNPLATEPVVATSATYRVVGTTPLTGIDAIAAVPRGLSEALANWKVPVATSTVALTDPDAAAQAFLVATPGGVGTGITVPFLDKGIFNGREQLAVRVLDIDLNRLTNRTNVSDYWIPDVACDTNTQDCDVFTEGIVYAFREDAVREDEIVRPAATANSSSCLTVANITSNTCRMVTTPGSEKDPPLTPSRISLKPVDFVADPDRRPHGFRLRNGDDMSRNYARAVGMTFVTDNSVYIQGDFNRHFGKTKTNAGEAGTAAPMEEFTATVGDRDWTVANFYNDRTEPKLNQNFAQPTKDRWRPVEILADSFSILSDGFIDGAVDDTFTRDRPTSVVASTTSYMNQSRPNAAQTTIVRAGGTTAPVFIDRNGNAFVGTNPINTVASSEWTGLSSSETNRRLNTRAVQAPTSVNGLFIAGIVPSRPDQGYGGLQNFPRLIETWSGQSINIAGSFFQLNFATASTGPFEHDAWEPGSDPVAGVGAGEQLGYYNPPVRRWGYDPAMLYYPPAAAARRFVSVDTPRSEYYRELPADDPYIVNLRCAKNGANFVFNENIRGTCPA